METESFAETSDDNEFHLEMELFEFLRYTMLSSAVSKHVTKFCAFRKKLIQLPNEKRFSFTFDFFESIDGFPEIKPKPLKSSDEALKLKNLGNAAFKRGNFIEALKMYTQSVSVAPAGSSDLAVAFGNRSAALFELKRYEGCIVDINRALDESYPEASRGKLLSRKQKCCSRIMELKIVDFDFENSLEKLSVNRREHEMKKNCGIDEDALDLDYTGKFSIPEAKLTNKTISDASDKIKIEVNSTFGRHIVAVKDIDIGEIIAMEKAYSAVLLEEYRYSHCAKCFIRCEVLIPCPVCSSVMYCGQRCRQDDFNRSHRIECQIFFYSSCLGLPLPSSVRLAIQTLMVVTKQGENLKKLMKDPLSKDPMKQAPNTISEELCSQNAILRILSLLNDDNLYSDSHDSSTDPEVTLKLYRSILISYILRQTTYFNAAMTEKTEVDTDSTKERKYVGLLFFKLTISLPKYCVGVEELLQKNVKSILMHRNGPRTFGLGFYLFHSLFNHSCSKNVTGCLHKVTLVSQAVQPIKAGLQLFMSYGPNFLNAPRIERQKQLRRDYQFDCCCVACREDWPLVNELSLVPNDDLFSQLTQFGHEFREFSNNFSCLTEYNSKSFDFLCKLLTVLHEKYEKPTMDYFTVSVMFESLLQARGNNYVYPRDEVLMSL